MNAAARIKRTLPITPLVAVLALLAATGAGIHGWSLAGASVVLAWTAALSSLASRPSGDARTRAWPQLEWVYFGVLLFLVLMLLPLPLPLTTLTGLDRYTENKVAAARLRQAAALDLIDLPALLFSTTRNRAGTLRVLAICIGAFSCAMLSRRMAPALRHLLLKTLVVGSAGIAAAGTLAILFYPQGDTLWWTITVPRTLPGPAACFINRNHFGGFAALLCPCAVVMAAHDMRKRRWLAALLMTLCAVILAISVPVAEARGALLAGLAAFLVLPVFLRAGGHRKQACLTLIPILILLVTAGLLITAHKQDSMEELLQPTRSGSLQRRMQVWHECLVNWWRRPLLGNGPNSLRTAYPMWRHSSVSGHRTHAENMYIEVLFDSGIAGFALAAWALAALVINMQRARRSQDCEPPVYYAVAGALVVAAVHAMVEFAIYVPLYAFTLATLVGLVLPASTPPHRHTAVLTGALLSLVVAFTAPVLYRRDSIYVIPRTSLNELARSIVWAPTARHAWFYAGRRMMRSTEFPVRRLGERFMTQSIVYDPNNYRHWRRLGEMRWRLRDHEGARQAYEHAHALRAWVKVPPYLINEEASGRPTRKD